MENSSNKLKIEERNDNIRSNINNINMFSHPNIRVLSKKPDSDIKIDDISSDMHLQIKAKNKIIYTKFKYYNTIKYILNCSKNKNIENNLFNNALEYLNERLDVIYYIKAVEKLDRLKVLLLNYNQNISLDYIKKPNLNSKNDLDSLHINLTRNYDKEMNDLILYYKQKLERNELDELDKQLIELIDPIIQNKIHSNN
jgi:hypothetical protein